MRKPTLLVATAVVLVLGFVLAQHAGTTKTTSGVRTVSFAHGKPVGGVAKLVFKKGERVRFRVHSDVADEIHVHGFDKKAEIAANSTVAFDFPATSDGVYVVEVEGAGTQIATLEVQP